MKKRRYMDCGRWSRPKIVQPYITSIAAGKGAVEQLRAEREQGEELPPEADSGVSRVNYICRLASISFAGSPPWPGPVAGQRWSGSWGRQTPG